MGSRRVFVTGGSGFLGRYVVEKFKSAGSEVLAPTRKELDLRIQEDCRRALEAFDPDVVVHLAAVVGGIGANRKEPGRFFQQNLVMGMNMIEAARVASARKFIQVGTVCSYPKFTEVPFSEDALWNGYPEETNAPYGIAKKVLLTMLQSYREQYKMSGIYLIPVNLYGPGDNISLESSHVVPALIRKILVAKSLGRREVEVWGTGQATREFLYVEDAALAITMAADLFDGPEPVNLGSGEEVSIKRLTGSIGEIVGWNGEIVFDPSKPDGQPRRRLDVSRAEKAFGWSASTSLLDGLVKTISDVARRLEIKWEK